MATKTFEGSNDIITFFEDGHVELEALDSLYETRSCWPEETVFIDCLFTLLQARDDDMEEYAFTYVEGVLFH